MRDILAPIVEAVLGYHENEIFCNLIYDSNDYTLLGLAIVLIPLLVLFVFYKFADPILPKRLQWLIAVAISILFVVISSYLIIMNGSMEPCYVSPENCEMNQPPTSENLITSLIMGLLSIASSIIFTIGLRYISNNNKTNPF
jgi:drug/metabolite transporter (DMT)-like permease